MTQDTDSESSEFIPLDTNNSTDSSGGEEDLSERQRAAKEAIEGAVDDFWFNPPMLDGNDSQVADHGECDRCERRSKRVKLTVGGENVRYICDNCRKRIVKEIDDRYWYDRFLEEHYNIISAYLSTLDEVWCVKDNAYVGGEMWIHTGHCTAEVVRDVLEHMGSIYSIHIKRADEDTFDCVEEHGDCVEICLDFGSSSVPIYMPSPTQLGEILYTSSYRATDHLTEDDRLFSRDDRESNEDQKQ